MKLARQISATEYLIVRDFIPVEHSDLIPDDSPRCTYEELLNTYLYISGRPFVQEVVEVPDVREIHSTTELLERLNDSRG